jgi:nitroreductase
MPTRRFHVNLTSKQFPHNFTELSSTVVQATPFENNRQLYGGFSGEDAEQSLGICQAYYVENVLPISRGYSSVSFKEALPPIAGLPEDAPILGHWELRGVGRDVAWLAVNANGQYIYDRRVGDWTFYPLIAGLSMLPFVVYVKERTFICYPRLGVVYEYNFGLQTVNPVTLNGLNVSAMDGFFSTGAYLLAWDKNRVYWSSSITPLEFDPLVDVTAGSQGILAVLGEIVGCVPLGDGFVVYTATNAVASIATSNTLFPFQFAEIPGSAGISSIAHVTQNGNRNSHITWTASGFQEVTVRNAEYVFPELSDGVIRGITTELDNEMPALTRYTGLDVRLSLASNRWLCISVKRSTETIFDVHEIHVYDMSLQRWGRLWVPHREALQFAEANIVEFTSYAELADLFPTYGDMAGVPYAAFFGQQRSSAPQPGENFAVAKADGSVYVVRLYEHNQQEASDVGAEASESKIFLGRFKVYRTQGAKLQSLSTIGVAADAVVRAYGHRADAAIVAELTSLTALPRQPGTYKGRLNADSFTIAISGDFALTDMVLEATEAGMRNQRAAFYADGQVWAEDQFVRVGTTQVTVE